MILLFVVELANCGDNVLPVEPNSVVVSEASNQRIGLIPVGEGSDETEDPPSISGTGECVIAGRANPRATWAADSIADCAWAFEAMAADATAADAWAAEAIAAEF